MPLCPQITNTPITVTQTADFTVTSIIPLIANTYDGLANNIEETNAEAAAALAAAASATTIANSAAAAAGAAQSTANTALANAATAYTAAIGSLQPSANTIVNASNQITAINGNGITVYSGSSATTGARVVLNSAGLAGFNSSSTGPGNGATFSISASTGAAIFSGDVTGATITGSSLNIAGKFIVNGTTGVMTATDATVTGTINATAGYFGTSTNGFSISSTGLVGVGTGTIVGGTIQGATFNNGSGTFFVSSAGVVTATSGTVGGWTLDSGGYLRNAGLSTFLYPSTGPGGNANTYAIYSDRGFLGSVLQVQSSSTTALYAPFGGLNVGLGITAANNNFVVSSAGAITSVGNISSSGTVSGSTISGTNVSASSALSSSGTLSVTSTATFSGASNSFPNITQSTSAANLRWGTTTSGRIFESTASSARFKTDIVDLLDVEELNPKKLLDLPVHAFRYKDDYLGEEDERSGVLVPGFIAEEVDQFYPIAADYELGQPNNWNDKFMVPAMLSLIQDLYKEIAILKGE